MILENFWKSLETSAVGDFVATSAWAFPTIETVHVIAIVTVVGTIAIMDLRLLGFPRSYAVRATSRDTLPWTWGAFVLAVITGLLLFVSRATSYMVNPYFLIKMVLIAIAGLNMAIFHVSTWKTVEHWDNEHQVMPFAAKLAGGLSLFFWILVIFFGRAIGFTLGMY